MKKTTRSVNLFNETEEYTVLVEPLSGHSDTEVVTSLQDLGASTVEILAPGFISARATGMTLRRVEHMAHIHVKPEKQSRALSPPPPVSRR